MNIMPTVSYVVISYNQGCFLEQAIKSILDQNYPHLELILVDGGSTDNSLDIINKYEEHFAWWVSEPDASPEQAINKGFAHATGKYINFLPSDDILMPEALRKMVEFLESNPECDGIFGNCRLIDSRGQRITDRKEVPFDRKITLYAFNHICQATGLFRRDTIERMGGIREDLYYPTDMELWLRMDSHGCRFGFIEDILAGFRFHAESKSTSLIHDNSPNVAAELRALKKDYGWSCKYDAINRSAYFLLRIYFRMIRKIEQVHRYGSTNILPDSVAVRKRLSSIAAKEHLGDNIDT